VPVFLKAIAPKAAKPTGIVDLAELDALVPQEARNAYHQAMRAISERRSKDAISDLKRALEIYPDYFRALNDLGVILMKLDRLDEAAQALERASHLAPRVYYPRLNLGVIRTRQKRYHEAITLLERLHKDNPALIEVRVPLADALMADGRLDAAEAHLLAAIADVNLDAGTMGDAHYKLGLLLNRKERFEEAVTHLTLAAKTLPNSARTHLQLGGALMQIKRLDQAERELIAAYQLGGAEMGAAQFLLGQIYFIDNRYDKAVNAFEQYLADVPQAPNISEVRALIEKIKTSLRQK
jgi:Flp pilus assembly protein TadD